MIKAASASWHGGSGGGGGADEDEDVPSSVEEVEMGLLAHDERGSSFRENFADVDGDELDDLGEGEEDVLVGARAAALRDGYGDGEMGMKVPLTREDKKAMALLIVLCASLSSLAFSPHPVCVYRPVVADFLPPMLRCAFRAFCFSC